MRRLIAFVTSTACCVALCVAAEETTSPPTRPAPSIFSHTAPAIPTTVDEMLPRHLRSSTNLATISVSTNSAPVVFSFAAGSLEGDASADIDQVRMERIYRKLERGGHLARRDPPTDNRFVRAMDAVFTPEVIQVGGAAFAFSPYTAIKRKNPFCLLNPVPIVISW
jgi:hypothetical protein